MTNEELQQQIEQLEQQIKDLKVKLESKAEPIPYKPYEVEVPEDIGDYYYVSESGDIDLVEDVFHDIDYEGLYLRGLAFKTREKAEQFDKERILINKLKKWAKKYNGGWTPDWEGDGVKWYVTYETDRNILKINWCVCCRQFIKLPYFKNEELAREFIEKFGEEIIEVLC